MSLSGTINTQFATTLTKNLIIRNASDPLSGGLNFNWPVVDGTGPEKATKQFAEEVTLAGSGSKNYDLQTLLDAFGDAVSFTLIKAIFIENDDANANDLEVGAAGANEWLAWLKTAGDIIVIQPSGIEMAVDRTLGYAVGGSSKQLLITNTASGNLTYRIAIIGE